ncbi:hypothetical protein F5887DRAFT_1081642 [Amanita rubescens]|nr:hypothetical protein F5887DRAFT_1081642 [Amanita rubescens]
MNWQNSLKEDVVQRALIARKTLKQPLQLYSDNFGSYNDYQPSLGSDEFKALSPGDIQKIFRSKHILVEGMEYDLRMEFDRRDLERVGNWDEPRTLQDLSIEPDTPKGFNGRLMTGSLKSQGPSNLQMGES